MRTTADTHPDGQVVDRPAVWQDRVGLIPESTKLAQVAINLTPMQTCTVCFGASHCNGLHQLIIYLNSIKGNMIKNQFFF